MSNKAINRFREEVRRFFADEYPADILRKHAAGHILDRDDHIRSQRSLQSRGWLAGWWPREHGGAGWSDEERRVFDAEASTAGMPAILPMAVTYVGPVIYTFGTEAQRQRWLPDILSSRSLWAQGYSEPDAGSDLASLRMSARREGDCYVLDGNKIWTSAAHWADWIFCLVRTSRGGRPKDGISFICVDMRSPGVTIHPIRTIDGGHHLNRVEFDGVRVPVDQLIGREGEGWRYATFLLQGERLSYAQVARKRAGLRRIRAAAGRTATDGGRVVLDGPLFAARLAECEIDRDLLDVSVARIIAAGDAASAAQISAIKILATELEQRMTHLGTMIHGPSATVGVDRHQADWPGLMPLVAQEAAPAMAAYLFERAQTIYGGATEVQKSIIWRHLAR